MDPARLTSESFSHYPPRGAALAAAHLETLRRIPLALLPLVLLRLRQFDSSFPVEQAQLTAELDALQALPPDRFAALTQPFAALALPVSLQQFDWLNQPQQFTEKLTAWLWSQRQIDAFHAAAEAWRAGIEIPPVTPIAPRWTVVLIGRDSPASPQPLFRKLAPHGATFLNVDPTGGTAAILAEAARRAAKFPAPYAHWYIDGADPLPAPGLTAVSYSRLVPAARKEFQLLRQFSQRLPANNPGVESATSYVASLTPESLGLPGPPNDPLRAFEVSILTQGAGCQIFSTTFVQWAARECLHRAQPVTLVARFSSRQSAAPLEQLLNRDPLLQSTDPAGSLIDADMGAFYTWINQSRLPGADQSAFLAWWEDHPTAIAIAPTLPRGSTSSTPATIPQLLSWLA